MSPEVRVAKGLPASTLLVAEKLSDAEELGAILRQLGWTYVSADNVRHAARLLARQSFEVVLCATDGSSAWYGVLEEVGRCAHPPMLIVTARLADERLWAEVLNCGGYDVLAQPFDRTEVERVVTSARQTFLRRAADRPLPRPAASSAA